MKFVVGRFSNDHSTNCRNRGMLQQLVEMGSCDNMPHGENIENYEEFTRQQDRADRVIWEDTTLDSLVFWQG